MKDELVKDLENIAHDIEDKSTTVGAIFDLETFNVNYKREYAARLAELGYVKMSDDHPCEGCKHKEFIRVRDDDRNFQDLLKDDLYVKAADLESLGYVKVVRCGECRWLEERVVWQAAGGEASKMYICKSPHSHMKGIARFDGDYYCSKGEAMESEDA